jgi:hypothetical protein
MIPRLLVALALVATAALSLLPSAGADYPPCHDGYCAPTHYGRSYGRSYAPSYHRSHYRSQWSKWAYTPWDQHPEYFTRHHTWYDDCGHPTNYFDDWLYTRWWNGCEWTYRKHCLLSEYAGYKPTLSTSPYIDPLGTTEVAYDRRVYHAAKGYPPLTQPGVLAQKGLPEARSANELLAPYESTAAARVEYASKSDQSAKELAFKVYQGEQQREAEQERIRGELAIIREQGQQDERAFAEFKDFIAVRRQRATIDASPRSRGNQISFDTAQVNSAELGTLLNTRCVSCHGATQQAGKLDLRDYASFDADKWKLIRRVCEEKDMPKEGEPLTAKELDLLDEQVAFVRSKG